MQAVSIAYIWSADENEEKADEPQRYHKWNPNVISLTYAKSWAPNKYKTQVQVSGDLQLQGR